MQPDEVDDDGTRSSLLTKVADWHNDPAWIRFHHTYDPRLRRWCHGYGLGEEAIDEICARIWCELAVRMRNFEYDPTGSFRGWLRQISVWRVLNYLQELRAGAHLRLGHPDDTPVAVGAGNAGTDADTDEPEEETDPVVRQLREAGEQIQRAVKARIKPHNWEAFWLVAVYHWDVERTAKTLRMKKAAVYAAVTRVRAMLRDEGVRVSEEWAKGA